MIHFLVASLALAEGSSEPECAGGTASTLTMPSYQTTCQMVKDKLEIHYGFDGILITLCIKGETNGWIGFGPAKSNAKMDDAMVGSISAISSSGADDEKVYRMEAKVQPSTPAAADVVTSIMSSVTDGSRMLCFQLSKDHLNGEDGETLTAANFVFAYGGADTESLAYHLTNRGLIALNLESSKAKSTSATSKTTTMSDTMPTALSADSCIIQLDAVVTEDLQDCKCGDGDEVCTVGQLCHSSKNESGTDVAQCSNRPDPFAPITHAEQCPGSWRQTKVTPTSTTTATPDSTHKPASSTISTTTTTTTTTASSTAGTTPATTTTDSTTTTSTSPTTSTTTSTTITTSTTTTTASTTTADSTSTTSTTTDSTTTADSTTTTTTTTTAIPTVTVVRCGSVICDVGEACKAKGYTQEKKCVVLSCGAGTRGPCQCKSSMCDANSYCHIDLYNTRDPGSCKVIETCPPDVRLTRSEFPKGCTCFDQHCAIESGSSKVCSEDAGCGSRSFKVSAEASSGSSGTLPLLIGGCMAVVGLMFIGVVAMSVMSKRTQLKKNSNTTGDQDKDDDLANTSLPPQHAYFADE